jgi:hypothetical protein
MLDRFIIALLLSGLWGSLPAAAGAASGRVEPLEPPFRYVGGTEMVERDCKGKLEVTSRSLVFACPSNPVQVPFSSITLMQFRSDLSWRVRHMKLKWKVWPGVGWGKTNRYLTIVFREEGVNHAIILRVKPEFMRPYLAEIELKSGKRVEVKGYEEYE